MTTFVSILFALLVYMMVMQNLFFILAYSNSICASNICFHLLLLFDVSHSLLFNSK